MRPTPQRKAVCIGVAYTRDSPDFRLNGTKNDARRMKKRLEADYRYTVTILLDEEGETFPTRNNIRAAIDWLVEDAQAGDRLFFHFSGHGAQIINLDGSEVDGKDELILPCDWEECEEVTDPEARERYPIKGRILDDELHEWLVNRVPPGCYLHALFDCCHSGTALDLQYSYSCPEIEPCVFDIHECSDKVLMGVPTEGQALASRAGRNNTKGRQKGLGIEGEMGTSSGLCMQGKSKQTCSGDLESPAVQGGHVYSWSACSDAQRAGERSVSGEARGFMVDAFLNCLHDNPAQTYKQMLIALKKFIWKVCDDCETPNGPVPKQDPELGSNLRVDMNEVIVI